MEGGTNSGSSVADCIHTVNFQNICKICASYHANQMQGGAPHELDLRFTTTTKEIDERSQNTILLASTQAVYKAPHSTV